MTRPQTIRAPSALLLAAARFYLQRYAARHFSGLRVARDGSAPELSGPTVFYTNHASWWDPVVILLLIRTHYPDWRFHGPIDADALRRYPLLERLGLFPLEADSLSGARRFLEVGTSLLESERTGIAMTAQGQFADVRTRPVRIKGGLAHLLRRRRSAVAIPLAIEYAFWNERLPEALVRFGQRPIAARGRNADAIQAELESALEHQQDLLARDAIAREPERFESLLEGRRGVGFLQDLPLRLKALAKGKRFDPSHAAIGRDDYRAR